jgi:Asp-tRNA(Asn)/Glu-tRNA(Gln) amidotransferase B subunit
MSEFKSWQASRQAQVKAGQVLYSVYYAELWSRMNQLPNDPQKPLWMATTAELIPLARRFEAGQITKEQFEDSRRIIISRTSQEQQIIQQRQQAVNDAQAEQLYRIGNQVLQPNNTSTNCVSTRVAPNQVNTNCR